MIINFENKTPQVPDSVFIAEGAKIIGDVHMGKDCSVWFNTIIRGDVHYIRIGERTNIQDLSMVHVTTDTHATIIGDDVTVGHKVMLHGCKIGDRCLIGMSATIMDDVEIGNNVLVAAGSLVAPGTKCPDGVLLKGSPAKVARDLKPEEIAWFLKSSERYQNLAKRYLNQ
ncbi:MAG: gamma carbonic anhydrase family protein [Deltaproteobacteria bacterium]|nr:gamma carbonic anhydrase family protein [Deltaproteobacteria bacterium]